jgi:putative transposase
MMLERLGLSVSLNKVKRIKRQYNLVTKIRRRNKFRMIAKQGEEHSVADNLVKRQFDVKRPDRVYSTDITMIHYGPGKTAYLSAVKDLGTKEVLLHTVSAQITMDIARKGLKDLLIKLPLRIRRKLILHSDQGTHYTHQGFRELLKEVKVKQSMSRKGNCLDNAPIESFFGHLKDEMDLGSCRNVEELAKETAKYIDYYNHQRPQWGLEKRTPAESRGSG